MTSQGRVVGAVAALAATAAVIFEQSPANEAVRANLAFRSLDYSGDPVVVGLVVAGVTLLIEGGAAALVMLGMKANPTAIQKLTARFGSADAEEDDDDEDQPTKRKRVFTFTDVGIALGIGAAIVVLKRALADRPSWSHLATAAAAATAVIAVVSGLIGYLVAGGVETAARYGLETPANYIVRYGADWRFWLIMIGGAQLLSWTYKKVTTRGTATASEPSPATNP